MAEWLPHATLALELAVSLMSAWAVHIKCSLARDTEEERFIDKGKIIGTRGPDIITRRPLPDRWGEC